MTALAYGTWGNYKFFVAYVVQRSTFIIVTNSILFHRRSLQGILNIFKLRAVEMQFWKGQVVTYGMGWYMVLVPWHFSKTAGKYLSLIIWYNLMILLFLGMWTICIFLCKYVMASGYEKQSTFTFKDCESFHLNKWSMSTICIHNSNIGKNKFIGESIFEQERPKGNPLVRSIGVVEITKKRFIQGTGMKVHITETCVETYFQSYINDAKILQRIWIICTNEDKGNREK